MKIGSQSRTILILTVLFGYVMLACLLLALRSGGNASNPAGASGRRTRLRTLNCLSGAIIAVDLNHDGILDLVTANGGDDSVSVALGRGDGTFRPPIRDAAAGQPRTLGVVDLDGDGNPDIVTANYQAGNVTVLLGDGKGSFKSPMTYYSGHQPTWVTAADFNRDGVADLAVANGGDNEVSILLGLGGGRFQAPAPYPVGAYPVSVAAADLNGNMSTDLVVVNRDDSSVTLLMGRGDGTFEDSEPCSLAPEVVFNPHQVALCQMDRRSGPEVVVANEDQSTLTILRRLHNGCFEDPVRCTTYGIPRAIVLADVNGNHRPDLVVSCGPIGVEVLLSRPDGTFSRSEVLRVGRNPVAAAVGDFNRDGKSDLAVLDSGGTVKVLLGRGDGTFAVPGASDPRTPTLPRSNEDRRAGSRRRR